MKQLFVFILLAFLSTTQAQFDDVFAASKEDAEKFVTNYTTPLIKGLMYSNNSGWSSSAKPLDLFKFEFKINASGAFVPTELESFKFDESDYNYLKLESGPDELPTVMGGDSSTRLSIQLPHSGNQIKVYEFDAPGGIKNELPMNIIPMPSVQLSMGLILGTEINVRYVPHIEEQNAFVDLLGVGIKHSISQYFSKKKEKNDKHFNLSLQVMYQNLSAGYLDTNSDKAVHFSMHNFSYQALASIDYKLFSLYSAIGYSNVNSTIDVLGTYDYTYDIKDGSGNVISNQTISYIDPLSTKYSAGGLNGTIGAKLQLAFFSVFADYTLQEFPVANVGLGIKF
jgi:hypothetical protein